MEKETFILRTEWYPAISTLEPEAKAELLDTLFQYHRGTEEINLNNPSVKLVWLLIEPNLKRNIEAYDKRKETSKENGLKGGRPRKTKPTPNLKEPNETQSETKKPNETLSVSVSEPVLEPVSAHVPEPASNGAKAPHSPIGEINTLDNKALKEKKKKFDFSKALETHGVSEILIKGFLELRKLKKAPPTEAAFNILLAECQKFRLPLTTAVETCVERNWVGFKHSWYINLKKTNGQQNGKEYLHATGQDLDTLIAQKHAS